MGLSIVSVMPFITSASIKVRRRAAGPGKQFAKKALLMACAGRHSTVRPLGGFGKCCFKEFCQTFAVITAIIYKHSSFLNF